VDASRSILFLMSILKVIASGRCLNSWHKIEPFGKNCGNYLDEKAAPDDLHYKKRTAKFIGDGWQLKWRIRTFAAIFSRQYLFDWNC
jgi:hypothetical protein